MGIPWNYGPKHADVPGNQYSLVQLNVPYRGVLRTLNLSIDGGTSGTFALYDSERSARDAVALGENSEVSSASGSVDIPVIGSQVHAGNLASGAYFNNNLNVSYLNRDGSPSNGVRRLWLVINPAGGGLLQLVISAMIETPNLR